MILLDRTSSAFYFLFFAFSFFFLSFFFLESQWIRNWLKFLSDRLNTVRQGFGLRLSFVIIIVITRMFFSDRIDTERRGFGLGSRFVMTTTTTMTMTMMKKMIMISVRIITMSEVVSIDNT